MNAKEQDRKTPLPSSSTRSAPSDLRTLAASTDDRCALECDHCGGDAILSDARGMFRDGDGTECMTCGYPGSVSVDVEDVSDFDNESEENVARWSMREEPGDFCRDPNCDECKELVAAAVGVTT